MYGFRICADKLQTGYDGQLSDIKAVQMGRDLSLSDAIRLDQLVGERQSLAIDPTGDVECWLKSQKAGPKDGYKRPDAK